MNGPESHASDAAPAVAGGRLARRAIMAAVALGAAGAGAWWGTRRLQLAPAAESAPDFWQSSLPSPDGRAQALSAFQGRPAIVNFWATWCPPCVEELPLLARFHAQQAANGVQVLGLAVDKVEPVQRFLAKMPLGFPVLMAGMEGVELSRKLGNTAGGLPFSVLFGRDGRVRARKLGQLQPADLTDWVKLAGQSD